MPFPAKRLKLLLNWGAATWVRGSVRRRACNSVRPRIELRRRPTAHVDERTCACSAVLGSEVSECVWRTPRASYVLWVPFTQGHLILSFVRFRRCISGRCGKQTELAADLHTDLCNSSVWWNYYQNRLQCPLTGRQRGVKVYFQHSGCVV